ncbi:hypothetical protein [Actinomyces culturomici]|uniref:hypothetical protein n=1 Tax=Actinomyces culturomici TaxID=1926276 RepID=UPI0013586FD9|nr:hypothetical protein [Actinomyces culturomici]
MVPSESGMRRIRIDLCRVSSGSWGALPAIATGPKVGIISGSHAPFPVGVRTGRSPPGLYPLLRMAMRSFRFGFVGERVRWTSSMRRVLGPSLKTRARSAALVRAAAEIGAWHRCLRCSRTVVFPDPGVIESMMSLGVDHVCGHTYV